MELAIANGNETDADVLSYAASKRGHNVVAVSSTGRLLGNLPFTPSTVIISMPKLDEQAIAGLRKVHERFPDATMLAVYEHAAVPARTAALESGAHDLLSAPLDPVELIRRAEAWQTARGSSAPRSNALTLEDLEVDLHKYAVKKNGANVVLTRLELRLLYCLCEHYPNLAPSERLLTFGWEGMDEPDASLIKTHISHIRKKLGEAGGTPLDIRSRQGVGYVLSLREG